ncbi:hypothetical protein OKA05_15965 [Luteolibacter arcticus]|uniref:Uncharacterized protein n=1 Tax=Luteolibacter arcticus TaxID=1581411 RepID=A0ABT3GKM3_9BACT|nr:hypothetical protein [Luteolibacter arcticus]MCW1924064.1 hypothetical protein [Luteolibacter arcticus]
MNRPTHRPDPTLVAMIVSTGILIAWAYAAARSTYHGDLQSGVVPMVPALLEGD